MKTPFFALALLLASLTNAAHAAECVAICQYTEVENDGTIYNKVANLTASDEDAAQARLAITKQCREELQGRLVSSFVCQ